MEGELGTPEGWKCAICMQLLYKPAVNSCGHCFCSWCLHRAMSPWAESSCPLCRARFVHYPFVATKLHALLGALFPAEYAARAEETAEEEIAGDVAAPDLEDVPPAASAPGRLERSDFLCDTCGELLYRPTALNCGHMVCGVPGCLGTDDDDEIQGCECAACSQPIPMVPKPCKLLADLLQAEFSDEYSLRALLEPDVATTAAVEATAPPDAPQEEEETTPVEGAAATAPTGLTGPHALIWKWLQGDDYTHFGVGCDCCGLYPIVGRRYRCTDCPEAVGFDLCGTCHDRGVGALVGRFNQRHRPEHRLEVARPRLTSLHMLRAANPDLSFDQLMRLLEISAARDDEGEGDGDGEGEEEGEEGEEGGEGVDAAAEGQEEADPEVPMPRSRGPRPAAVPGAEWPSPSAPPPEGGEQ
jgi:hypothetical protein